METSTGPTKSVLIRALQEGRPTYRVDLNFKLDDGKAAAVECRDLSPKDWWRIPDNRGLPIIMGKLGDFEEWSEADKLKYWDYLCWVCRFAITKIRDVEIDASGTPHEKWVPVEFADNLPGPELTDGKARMTIEQFDFQDNVSRVAHEVLFRGQLRGADEGPGGSGAGSGEPDRMRKAGKRKRGAAARGATRAA